ncbi:MAG: hypothetical protein ACXVFM_17190 [Solirubrobacteraceae bacterium]
MATEQGRSMTGWGRGAIAAAGAVVLVVTLAVQLTMGFLLTLCGLSDSPPDPGTWCAVSNRVQDVAIIAPMVVSVVACAWTVWRARLTPVLLGGPGLTVIWVAGLLLIYGS